SGSAFRWGRLASQAEDSAMSWNKRGACSKNSAATTRPSSRAGDPMGVESMLRPRSRRRVRAPVVESPSALAAVHAREHHPLEQRRRSEPRLLELLEHDLRDVV